MRRWTIKEGDTLYYHVDPKGTPVKIRCGKVDAIRHNGDVYITGCGLPIPPRRCFKTFIEALLYVMYISTVVWNEPGMASFINSYGGYEVVQKSMTAQGKWIYMNGCWVRTTKR